MERTGKKNKCTGFCLGNLRERDNSEYLGVDGIVILTFRHRASSI